MMMVRVGLDMGHRRNSGDVLILLYELEMAPDQLSQDLRQLDPV